MSMALVSMLAGCTCFERFFHETRFWVGKYFIKAPRFLVNCSFVAEGDAKTSPEPERVSVAVQQSSFSPLPADLSHLTLHQVKRFNRIQLIKFFQLTHFIFQVGVTGTEEQSRRNVSNSPPVGVISLIKHPRVQTRYHADLTASAMLTLRVIATHAWKKWTSAGPFMHKWNNRYKEHWWATTLCHEVVLHHKKPLWNLLQVSEHAKDFALRHFSNLTVFSSTCSH